MLVRIELGSLENLSPNIIITTCDEKNWVVLKKWFDANNRQVLKNSIAYKRLDDNFFNSYLAKWHRKIKKEETKKEIRRLYKAKILYKKTKNKATLFSSFEIEYLAFAAFMANTKYSR